MDIWSNIWEGYSQRVKYGQIFGRDRVKESNIFYVTACGSAALADLNSEGIQATRMPQSGEQITTDELSEQMTIDEADETFAAAAASQRKTSLNATDAAIMQALENSELLKEIQARIGDLAPLESRITPIPADYQFRTLEAPRQPRQRNLQVRAIADRPEEWGPFFSTLDRNLIVLHILTRLEPIDLAALAAVGRAWQIMLSTQHEVWTPHLQRIRPINLQEEMNRRSALRS